MVFVIINNQFGMGTALHRHSAVTDLSLKAQGFGVPGTRCDGMDVLDVHDVVTEALRCARGAQAAARRGRDLPLPRPLDGRPRGVPHQGRGRGVARARPDPGLRQAPRGRGRDHEEEFEELDEEGDRDRRRGGRFADESPFPDLDSLYDDVYVYDSDVPGWWTVDERSPEVHRGEQEREAGELPHQLAEAGAAYANVGDREARARRQQKGEDDEDEATGRGRGRASGDEPEAEGGAD